MDAAIEVEGLTKRYDATLAVEGVRFRVPQGAVFGFLGPNGSGKTTTLGMLTGLIRPDSGTAHIAGHDVVRELPAALASAGALIEEPALYPHLTGVQNLRLLARIRGSADPDADAMQALAAVGLTEAAEKRYQAYSLGMRRRLGLGAALLCDPAVLLLDEPTNGLDPAGQREVRALVRDLARRGRTVLFSSHALAEVEEICTHVAIIHRGKILAQGEMAAVLSRASAILVRVDDAARARTIAAGIEGVRSIEAQGDALRIEAPAELAAEINRALVTAGVKVRELTRAKAALEERFLELTREGPG